MAGTLNLTFYYTVSYLKFETYCCFLLALGNEYKVKRRGTSLGVLVPSVFTISCGGGSINGH